MLGLLSLLPSDDFLSFVSARFSLPSSSLALASQSTPLSSTNASVTGLAPMVSLAMPLNYGDNPVLVPNPSDESNKVILAALTGGKFVMPGGV